MNTEDESKSGGLDLLGAGKVMESIPDEVFTQSADTVLTTFKKLVAPITETTDGFGRYLRQKFDNMVAVEKAMLTYTLQNAMEKATRRARKSNIKVHPPEHVKSYVDAIEHSSREMDPNLNLLWTNLLAAGISDGVAHPHFVDILSKLTNAEAQILKSLRPIAEIGENQGGYLSYNLDGFKYWVRENAGKRNPWSMPCVLLCHLDLADVMPPKVDKDNCTILYKTASGSMFLDSVSDPDDVAT